MICARACGGRGEAAPLLERRHDVEQDGAEHGVRWGGGDGGPAMADACTAVVAGDDEGCGGEESREEPVEEERLVGFGVRRAWRERG